MTDELAHALARLPGLRIAGRTSSYAFKGKRPTAQEIGRALDVGAFVERHGAARGRPAARDDAARGHGRRQGAVGQRVREPLERRLRRAGLVHARHRRRAGAGARRSRRRAADRGARRSRSTSGGARPTRRRTSCTSRAATTGSSAAPRTSRDRSTYFQQAIARDPTFARAHAGLALAYNVLAGVRPRPGRLDDGAHRGERRARGGARLHARRRAARDGARRRARLPVRRGRGALPRGARARAVEPVRAPRVRSSLLTAIGHTDEAIAELRAGDAARSAGQVGGDRVRPGAHRRATVPRGGGRGAPRTRNRLHVRARALQPRARAGVQRAAGQRGAHAGAGRAAATPTSVPLQGRLLFAYAAAGRWADVERMRAELRGRAATAPGRHAGVRGPRPRRPRAAHCAWLRRAPGSACGSACCGGAAVEPAATRSSTRCGPTRATAPQCATSAWRRVHRRGRGRCRRVRREPEAANQGLYALGAAGHSRW